MKTTRENFGILLINLPDKSLSIKHIKSANSSFPPLGLCYLSSTLKQAGFTKIKLVDFRVETFSEKEFLNILSEFDPCLVGISVYTENHHYCINISKLIKEHKSEVRIILGSVQATFMWKELMTESVTDFICRGEGEMCILELSEYLLAGNDQFSQIKGLVWRKGDEVISNTNRQMIKNLDSLPFPDRTLIEDKSYMTINTMLSTRGCPGQCLFCSSKSFWGNSIRIRKADSIFSEIISLFDHYGRNSDFFLEMLDDTFTIKPQRILEVCKAIISHGIEFKWGCLSRLDVLNSEILQIMHDAGCEQIQIGVECSDQKTLNEIGKKIDLEKLESILEACKNIGIGVRVGFMLGFPNDTVDLINERIEYAKYIWSKYDLLKVTLSYNTPFPGTYYYNNSEVAGITIHAKNWKQYSVYNPIISTKHLTQAQLAEAYHKFNLYSIKLRH